MSTQTEKDVPSKERFRHGVMGEMGFAKTATREKMQDIRGSVTVGVDLRPYGGMVIPVEVTVLPANARLAWETSGGRVDRTSYEDRIVEVGLDGTRIGGLDGEVWARVTSRPWVGA